MARLQVSALTNAHRKKCHTCATGNHISLKSGFKLTQRRAILKKSGSTLF